MRLLNRYWPAVSHSWSLSILFPRVTFLETKSIPIVGWVASHVHSSRSRRCRWWNGQWQMFYPRTGRRRRQSWTSWDSFYWWHNWFTRPPCPWVDNKVKIITNIQMDDEFSDKAIRLMDRINSISFSEKCPRAELGFATQTRKLGLSNNVTMAAPQTQTLIELMRTQHNLQQNQEENQRRIRTLNEEVIFSWLSSRKSRNTSQNRTKADLKLMRYFFTTSQKWKSICRTP